jgi:NADH-quinone oxidoreductase subunit J
MTFTFYFCSAVALLATILAITRLQAVHALLYLIVSLLAVAMIFFTLGAPFIAALEVIIYAGAIMVMFIFVVMLLNLGPATEKQERQWLTPKTWFGPATLSLLLLAELAYTLISQNGASFSVNEIEPAQIGLALFGPYILAVELASLLLLAGLVGAYHLGRRVEKGGST